MDQGSGVRRRLGAFALAVLASALTVSGGAISAPALDLPIPVTLLSISVTPAGGAVGVGGTQQFTATGTFSDLSTQNLTSSATWTSSDPAVASISNAAATRGQATGIATGGVTITATSGAIAGTAILAVTPVTPPAATLVAIAVTPAAASIAVGATQQFTATGTYSDASNQDLTSTATWTSSAPATASISNAAATRGKATGVSQGATTITATAGSIAGTAVLTVTPPVVIPTLPTVPTLPPILNPGNRLATVIPAAGLAGTAVKITGVGFLAGHRVKVLYRTGLSAPPRQLKLCRVMVAGDGRFTCDAIIPSGPYAGPKGTHAIWIKTQKAKGTPVALASFRIL